MRTIKFRAWDREMGDMVDVKTLDFGPTGAECAVDYLDINGDLNGEWDLLQYTGIKDKNGVEVYQDDIIKVEGHPFGPSFNGKLVVTWSDYDLSWSAGGFHLVEFKPYMTVIGSIHGNQDLLD